MRQTVEKQKERSRSGQTRSYFGHEQKFPHKDTEAPRYETAISAVVAKIIMVTIGSEKS